MNSNVEAIVRRLGARSDFRLFLQTELARRCAANERYSLRSFARTLGVDHSTLSQIMRGRRRLSDAMIERIGTALGLDEASIVTFRRRERMNPHTRGALYRSARQLARDTATLLADQNHRALVELTRTREFNPDSRWIARVLNITVDEVNVLVARLVRLGILRMESPSRWACTIQETASDDDRFARCLIERLAGRVREMAELPEPVSISHTATVGTRDAECLLALVDADRTRLTAGTRYRVELTITPVELSITYEDNDNGTTGDAVAASGKGS